MSNVSGFEPVAKIYTVYFTVALVLPISIVASRVV